MLDQEKIIKESLQLFKPVKGFNDIRKPNYHRNITMVLPTLMRSLGMEPDDKSTLYSDNRLKNQLTDILSADISNIIFLVVDSLGFKQFIKFSKLIAAKSFYFPLSSVFPSITSTAIMSLHTGVTPEQHGLLGYKIFIEELGTIIDTLKFSSEKAQFRDSLTKLGLDFSNYLWEQSLHKQLNREDILDVALYHYTIASTGLSTVLHDNIISFGDMIDAFSLTNRLLCKGDNKKLIHIYLDGIDELSHKYGPESLQVELGLKILEESLKAIKIGLPEETAKKTILVLTSDHGQHETDPNQTINLPYAESDEAAKYFRSSIGKSGRTLHFYIKPGMLDEAYSFLSDTIWDRGLLLKHEDLKKTIIHSKVHSLKVKQRLGDIICILTGGYTANLKNNEPENKLIATPLLGQHGGLTYDELCSICAFINLKEI